MRRSQDDDASHHELVRPRRSRGAVLAHRRACSRRRAIPKHLSRAPETTVHQHLEPVRRPSPVEDAGKRKQDEHPGAVPPAKMRFAPRRATPPASPRSLSLASVSHVFVERVSDCRIRDVRVSRRAILPAPARRFPSVRHALPRRRTDRANERAVAKRSRVHVVGVAPIEARQRSRERLRRFRVGGRRVAERRRRSRRRDVARSRDVRVRVRKVRVRA